MSSSSLSSPNNSIHQVLQKYQLFAMNDIRGPGSASSILMNAELAKLAAAQLNDNLAYKAVMESLRTGKKIPIPPTDFKLPSQLSAQTESKPFLMRADSRSVQGEAALEDQQIACFEIGGEKRLCLPQIFKTVLSGFSLDHINLACDKLCIYCSRCNEEQLDLFRTTRNLPATANTCGLITNTDAERLCMDLLHSSNDEQNNYMPASDPGRHPRASESCIPVYHECFGEGLGFLKPELYCSPDAKCVECVDCGRHFSMKQFVGHSHRNPENRICHWGFDRNNWRSYLLLADEMIKDDVECSKLQTFFNNLLDRFSEIDIQSSKDSTRKRKIQDEEDEKVKARRFSDSQLPMSHGLLNQSLSAGWMLTSPTFTFPPRASGWPAFTGISPATINNDTAAGPTLSVKSRLPTQKSCPPTLQHPDRVVPSSESSRYEKHFVPNIALQQTNESQSEAVKLEEDNERRQPSIKQELDTYSSTSTGSYPPNNLTSHSCTSSETEGLQSVTSVLENLARMENLYMQLLQSTKILCSGDKESMEQKYISCSDAIRQQILPRGSALHDELAES